MEKECYKCEKFKPLEDFGPYKASSDGRSTSCRPCMAEYSFKRTHSNIEKARKYRRDYYSANRDKLTRASREKLSSIKRGIYEHYGALCACCNEDTYEFLSIDHINNDGGHKARVGLEPPHHKGGLKFYMYIIKNGYPKDLQILCMNCNFGKRMNNGICPHIQKAQ